VTAFETGTAARWLQANGIQLSVTQNLEVAHGDARPGKAPLVHSLTDFDMSWQPNSKGAWKGTKFGAQTATATEEIKGKKTGVRSSTATSIAETPLASQAEPASKSG
jgi:hypothetical protein